MNRLKEANTFIKLCDEWSESWRLAPAHDIVYMTEDCFLEYYKYAPMLIERKGRFTTIGGVPFSVVPDIKPYNGMGDDKQPIKANQRLLFR